MRATQPLRVSGISDAPHPSNPFSILDSEAMFDANRNATVVNPAHEPRFMP
jgi:hypothetical protein